MLPAGQRLEARDLAALQRHDGLVVDRELAGVDGAPQLAVERELRHRARVHAPVEERALSHPQRLGAIGGGIRVAKQVLGAQALLAAEGHPHRRRGVDLAVGHAEGLLQRALEPLAGAHRGPGVVDALEEHAELVAAQPRRERAGLQRPADAAGDAAKQLVARAVAEAVVDHLETVEVEQDQRDRGSGAAARPLHRGGKTLHEGASRHQAGERIAQAHARQRVYRFARQHRGRRLAGGAGQLQRSRPRRGRGERLQGADGAAAGHQGKEEGDAVVQPIHLLPVQLAPERFVEEAGGVPPLLRRRAQGLQRATRAHVPDRPALRVVAQLQPRGVPARARAELRQHHPRGQLRAGRFVRQAGDALRGCRTDHVCFHQHRILLRPRGCGPHPSPRTCARPPR